MPKLEDLLKANGYTDSDIQAMAPMLTDQRFRDSVERSLNTLETERDQFKAERDTYENWRETVANPHIAQQERIAAEARIDAARAREEAKIARELGLFPAETPGATTPAPPNVSGTFDPKAHNLVTRDDFEKGYAQFADAEGRAIAMANDLSAEYSHLTNGKSLYEYVGQDGKRGMTALREEALRNKQQLDQYVATKFNFNQLRQQAADAAQKAHDDKIRAETQAEMAAKFGNPMLRTPMPSRQPFIPARTADSKQPWELTAQDRRNQRLERAMQNQFKGQPN